MYRFGWLLHKKSKDVSCTKYTLGLGERVKWHRFCVKLDTVGDQWEKFTMKPAMYKYARIGCKGHGPSRRISGADGPFPPLVALCIYAQIQYSCR